MTMLKGYKVKKVGKEKHHGRWQGIYDVYRGKERIGYGFHGMESARTWASLDRMDRIGRKLLAEESRWNKLRKVL